MTTNPPPPREDMQALHGSPPPTAPTETGRRRPTPLDPYPEASPETFGDEKAYPPELGTDAIAILEGRTFMLSNSLGDIPAGSIGGLLHDDTRFLSCWQLTIEGRPLSLLKSRVVDYYSAAFFLTNPDLPTIRANTLSVRRFRFVGGGLHEQVLVYNSSTEPVRLRMRLQTGADFADLFEVKSAVRDRGASIDTEHDADIGLLHHHYENSGFLAETNIRVVHSGIHVDARLAALIGAPRPDREHPPTIDGNDLVWDVEVDPRATFGVVLTITVRVNDTVLEPMHVVFGDEQERAEGALTRWLAEVPRFRCEDPVLTSVFDKSVVDLAALRIAGEIRGEPYVLPAAGLPWFMTLFGRDTLITSLQTIWVGPELARGALHLLGALQGQRVDAFRDEEPGKILHEIRSGELTTLEEKPHSPYYGTADATPLYLILMSEHWRYTADDGFVRARWPNVLAALEWIDRYGDRDADGYVEYQTRSSQGLGNQCWKDSWDGIQFRDGRIPYLPIATCEIQGYVYDAKLRVAELAERAIGDDELAARLRTEAEALFDRFNRDFWSDARGGFYVAGLDGDKEQIDSMTSNMGHLLWSGIVPGDRAATIAAQLMTDDMFSGWGVRTISREDSGFNPIGYHVGTIWPHDNAIIAMGLARYGFRDAANRIAMAQLDAAAFSEFRLPEAFAGFDRSIGRFPVPYPTACSPQAWATGAPFAFMKSMLGLDVRGGEVVVDASVPNEIGKMRIHGMHALGTHWDIEAERTRARVAPTH
ncbi:MAG TPA: glycogen debranching N-terminal domain-containing protein [Actinomycetota bacterium]|nr:glycogen debranching N-terminal domain-containing protein [Actinomycetota bacterium]